MKTCPRCKQRKPLSAFRSDKRRAFGKGSWCKGCDGNSKTLWYYKNGGKSIVRKNTIAFRKRTGYPGWSDPVKRKARNIAQSAIRRGRIKRQPCRDCGSRKVHAHHQDYSKPLEVVFLCELCHKAEHILAIRAGGGKE